MVNNKYIQEVETRYTSSGLETQLKTLRQYQEQVDADTRSGKLNEKQSLALSKALNRQEEALGGAAKSATKLSSSLPTLRYAMYDVAQTAGVVSAAIGATGTAALLASSSYESSFTAVERTSGAAGAEALKLRESLILLSRAIPQSFGEISNIAARGAQLGVASQELDSFTETVAQFVATSDTVSLDQAVEAFGRISNLLGDTDFNRIGSAITLVGVNAAATEAQIVKTTQELAPFATAVGMSADETIGLAAALGSLGQPPERARSAFLTLQRVMDTAIASGSDNLHAFSQLLNVSVDEVTRLWKQDPSQFIASFAQSLGSVEDLTTAFADLGINERRAVQVFQALAADSRNAGGGLSVLAQALQDSAQGYSDGTELARQYGLIVDDLASKWQLFLNSVKEFTAAAGDALAPFAKGVLDVATTVAHMLSSLSKTPAGKILIGVSAAVGSLVFALTAVIGSMALFVASMAAARTGLTQLTAAVQGGSISLGGLSTAFNRLAISAGVSSTALRNFRIALASTGIGLAVVALGSLTAAFMQTSESADEAFSRIVGSAGGLSEAIAEDTSNYLSGVIGRYTELTPVLEQNTEKLDENSAAIQGAATVLGLTVPAVDDVTGAIERNTMVLGDNAVAWLQNQLFQSEAFQKLAGNAEFVEYWENIGADFVEVTRIAATDGEAAVIEYFQRLERAYEAGQRRLGIAVSISDGAFDGAGNLQAGWLGGRGMGGSALGTGLGKNLNDLIKTTSGWKGQLDLLGTSSKKTAAAVSELAGESSSLGSTFEDVGGATGGVTEKLRTVLDYASDLSKVWSRAFDIRFSGQSTLDSITSSFIAMRDATAEASRRIRDLKNDINSLQSDIRIQEYFLSIAVEYGDTKRAAAIEADLTKKRAELADKSRDLQKEQDKTNKTLVGNSKAAIDNRKTITDLVKQYQSHVEALAASGMSQDELARATERLKQDFINQATQLGFNRTELGKYTKAFDDVAVAIKNVPRNVNVSISGLGPAQAALKEFEASIRKTTNNGKGFNIPITSSFDGSGAAKSGRAAEIQARIASAQRQYEAAVARGADNIAIREMNEIKRLSDLLNSGNYWTGGFVGRGGKYEPKGTVHGGEFVLRKDQVNQSTGMPKEAALLSMLGSLPSRTVAPAPSSKGSSGVMQVALTAGSIQALAQASGKNIYLDGELIASSSANSYATSNSLGDN